MLYHTVTQDPKRKFRKKNDGMFSAQQWKELYSRSPYNWLMTEQRFALLHSIGISAVTALIVSGASMAFSVQNGMSPPEPVLVTNKSENGNLLQRDEAIVTVVEAVEPAVVSVIISKDVPIIERSFERVPFDDPFSLFDLGIPRLRQLGTERRQIGGGTAFFIRSDGLLLTNKHVVQDPDADYTVFLNDGRTLQAKVVARDGANDIALLKVEGENFPSLEILNDSEPKLGQTVIAIGNALGEFRNTVSVGVISGLQRSILAGGLLSGDIEELNRIIQTDAAINQGNSGGPLIDLHGRVVGMNTAVAGGDAQNIAFAVPASDLSRALKSYEEHGKILRPYLGVRYISITAEVQKEKRLDYDYGVLASGGEENNQPAILPDSPAAKAGIREGDIILAADGVPLRGDVSLQSIVQQKLPGDRLTLHIARDGKERDVTVTLEEWTLE